MFPKAVKRKFHNKKVVLYELNYLILNYIIEEDIFPV